MIPRNGALVVKEARKTCLQSMRIWEERRPHPPIPEEDWENPLEPRNAYRVLLSRNDQSPTMTTEQPETEPALLSTHARISRTRAQASCDLGGEAVLLNLESGQYYGLDPVGARIWELLRSPHSVQSLQATILEEYEVDAETCLRDLSTLVAALQRAGLVEVQHGDAP